MSKLNKNVIWVIIIMGLLIMAQSEEKKTVGEVVNRVLPNQAIINQEVTITLTSSNIPSQYFSIVRDNIPTGWTYISGGSLEGNQVKGILSTLTGNSLTYTLKAPSSAATSTFSGTYQFSGAATPSTTIGDLSVITSSSGGCTPSQCSSECKTGSCASGNCVAQNKADGTACSTGTCQSGVCESQKTCAQLLGNICASGQQCTGGTMTDSSDTADLCCVGGTCEDTTITEQSCEEIKGCEFWEACNKTESKCTTAPWVYLVGAFMGMILLINSLK